MTGRHLKLALAGAALGLMFLPSRAVWADEPLRPSRLRVVFTADIFATVNRNDALASGKAWIEVVGRKRGLDLEVEVDVYETAEDLRTIARSQSADLYVVSTMHFLDLEADQALLDPTFLPRAGDFVLEEYLLLQRGDRRVPLPDLRGKDVILLKTAGANLVRVWVETVLSEEKLGSLASFVPAARDVAKPSSAILPVYFGQADACVVDASSFQIMQELNPQLGQSLEITLRSPEILETVICIHRDYSEFRKDLIEGLSGLHEETAGRQILMVFKIDRLVSYEDEALQSVRALRNAHRRIPRTTSR